MSKTLLVELEKLRKSLLTLASVAEEHYSLSLRSFLEFEKALAADLLERDENLDSWQVRTRDQGHVILTLHQPVAKDLRFTIAALNITTDFERIGDIARKIARIVIQAPHEPDIWYALDFTQLAQASKNMLSMSLSALINWDSHVGRNVLQADEQVDRLNATIFEEIEKLISQRPDRAKSLLKLMLCARHMERAADHATSIAKDVIFLAEGRLVSHNYDF